jgi:mRNA turnover protein 4
MSKDVEDYFANLAVEDFARVVQVSPKTVVLLHPVSMVEQFRKLGLPVEVKNGWVAFVGSRDKWEVCKVKRRSMGVKLAVFRIEFLRRWEKEEGTVAELQ